MIVVSNLFSRDDVFYHHDPCKSLQSNKKKGGEASRRCVFMLTVL